MMRASRDLPHGRTEGAPSVPTTAPVMPAITACRAAIKAVWPQDLQWGAQIVLERENRSENPKAKSKKNADGSYDYGCMQVNDKAHFGSKGWTTLEQIFDPVFNARIGLAIYQERGNWSPWYSVCPLKGKEILRCH